MLEQCLTWITPGRSAEYARVSDSSSIYAADPALDGMWLVSCGAAHLALRDTVHARRVGYDEELWRGKLERARETAGGRALTPARLAEPAGITEVQAERAMRWQAR